MPCTRIPIIDKHSSIGLEFGMIPLECDFILTKSVLLNRQYNVTIFKPELNECLDGRKIGLIV